VFNNGIIDIAYENELIYFDSMLNALILTGNHIIIKKYF